MFLLFDRYCVFSTAKTNALLVTGGPSELSCYRSCFAQQICFNSHKHLITLQLGVYVGELGFNLNMSEKCRVTVCAVRSKALQMICVTDVWMDSYE